MKYQKIHFLVMTALFTSPVVAEDTVENTTLDEVTVVATGEAQSMKESAHSIGVINKETIKTIKPAHPSEIMERIPGVHVNVTGGEGHMTSIRQPITTKAVYLYLEDGIPTRSTGFFNHNALYEINVPQSDRIEVLKGPGSALYGSDAIGGVINVETRPSPLKPEAEITVEAGDFGWARLLVDGGTSIDDDGYRASLNLTHTDGWRDSTAYDRQGATLRWDRTLQSGASLKTVIAYSDIDQETAGSSRLLADDYLSNPTLNYTPISYRQVNALRVSSAYEKETSDSSLTVTPYIRSNSMEMLPNWALSYDPTVYTTQNDSLGLLVKYRVDYVPMRTRLITGIDIDYSPGGRFEQAITATRTGRVYTSYVTGQTLYDYDATYQGISPYAHLEFSPADDWRITTGLRYDSMSYDYKNNLTSLATGNHRRPDDTSKSFDNLSAKLGATYTFSPSLNGFVAYREAFRAPSEGQLFRQGRSVNSVDLKPIQAASIETGIRGKNGATRYNLSLFSMSVKDDILTYRHPDNSRETMNAGETLHQGIELGLDTVFNNALSLNIASSYAKHSYEKWQPQPTVDYSGNEMESAPRLITNTRLVYKPVLLNGGQLELEWTKLGEYWMDAANTNKYYGHDLLNLRANYYATKNIEIFGRVMNIADKRYATSASYSPAAFGNPEKFEYAPGMPRTFYLGMKYQF